MDQLKVFLTQVVKYRFWVAIGISVLLPVIAYFVSAGALSEQEKAKTAEIKGAYDKVQKYRSGTVQNNQWTQEVTSKTNLMTQDVNASWRKLYDKQAPLLTWPKRVEPKFLEWGRKYPEGVDPQRVRDVVLEYIADYDAYVDEVYASFKPFNSEDGTGIVSAAPRDFLLAPESFRDREDNPPSLGEIWSAQEKLWIQRTILDVVAKVNEKAKAKDWDSAIVKQIIMLDVANPDALDQRSAAKSEEVLEDAPAILLPGEAAAPKDAEAAAAAPAASTSSVQYVKSPNPDQYFIVPIALKVYVDQDHVNDLLVEFANSPMSIQVLDFEFIRPISPVRKPQKGEAQAVAAAGGASRGGGAGSRGGADEGGGAAAADEGMSGASYAAGGATSYNNRMKGGSRGGGMPGMAGRAKAGGATGKAGGLSVVQANIKALREAKEKKDAKKDGDPEEEEFVASNPYFNVVEVSIKGQARFYKTPPKLEVAESANPVTPAADAAKADAAKPEAAKAEAAKPESPKAADGKADEAKTAPAMPPAEPAKGAPAPGDAPKTDAPPTPPAPPETPKADAPKPDAPPAPPAPPEAPKTDAPKAEPPKGDTPKA